MAAKASRTRTLFLLVALAVATLTVTVTVTPRVSMAGTVNPASNGDPDRPNDAPKPAAQPSVVNGRIVAVGPATGTSARGSGSGDEAGWSWAVSLIASVLGRQGL